MVIFETFKILGGKIEVKFEIKDPLETGIRTFRGALP